MFDEQDKRKHPAPDAMKLKHIASLYREMNLHPRAIIVLQKAAKIPGADVAAMEKEIIGQWTRMLENYPQKKGDTEFLFGKNLTTTPPMLVVPNGITYEAK